MEIFSTNQHFEFDEAFYPNGGKFGPLLGNHMEAFVLMKGHVVVISDEQRFELSAGEVCFIYNEHSVEFLYSPDNSSHVMWCAAGEFIPSDSMIKGFKEMPKILTSNSIINKIFKLGVETTKSSGSCISRKKDALAQMIFDAYFFFAHKKNNEAPIPNNITIIKKYIEDNFSNKLDFSELADSIGWHQTHMLRTFKKYIGYSPTQYMWLLRAEKGIFLLGNSGKSVSEIAYDCGFKNPYHFTNHIKKHYGHTPTELRNNELYTNVRSYLGQSSMIKY